MKQHPPAPTVSSVKTLLRSSAASSATNRTSAGESLNDPPLLPLLPLFLLPCLAEGVQNGAYLRPSLYRSEGRTRRARRGVLREFKKKIENFNFENLNDIHIIIITRDFPEITNEETSCYTIYILYKCTRVRVTPYPSFSIRSCSSNKSRSSSLI